VTDERGEVVGTANALGVRTYCSVPARELLELTLRVASPDDLTAALCKTSFLAVRRTLRQLLKRSV
jgi:hypothetical protein